MKTDTTDKTMKTLIRLLFVEQFDPDLHCLSFYLLHFNIILQRKPKLFNFRVFSVLVSGVPIPRGLSIAYKCSYSYNNVLLRSSWKPENQMKSGPEVIKLFSCSTQLSMKFFLLINVKMPTIVGILTFMSGKNSILVLSEPKRSQHS